MKDRKAHTHSRDVQPTHLRRNPQQAQTKSHRRDDEPLQESFPPSRLPMAGNLTRYHQTPTGCEDKAKENKVVLTSKGQSTTDV